MIQHEGNGWRLEINESKTDFPVLIGAENFSVELSKIEWSSLEQVILKLLEQFCSLKNSLMIEEKIFIELEISPWWGCLNGTKEDWSLKLILSGKDCHGRGVEILWPHPASEAIVSIMRIMWDSY